MFARKVLSKTAALMGGMAAMAVASPATAATYIDINRYAGNNAAATGWGESYSGGPTYGKGMAAAAAKSAVAPAAGKGFGHSSSVVFEAIMYGLDFQSRMASLPTPAAVNANLGQSVNVNAFSRVVLPASGTAPIAAAPLDPLGQGFGTPTLSAASATPVTAVPEPATWLMLLLGFGMAGLVMRRDNRQVRLTYS